MFCPPRDLADGGPDAQIGSNTTNRIGEAGAISIELVDVEDARDLIRTGLGPDMFGLGFDTRNSVEDTNYAIEDSQSTKDLKGEICVTRGVD